MSKLRIEVTTSHPNADKIVRVAAEAIADQLDSTGILWNVAVTDAIGIPFHEWGSEGESNE